MKYPFGGTRPIFRGFAVSLRKSIQTIFFLNDTRTRWWQLKYFLCSPRSLGQDEPNFDEHIFFRWVETNHQPDKIINDLQMGVSLNGGIPKNTPKWSIFGRKPGGFSGWFCATRHRGTPPRPSWCCFSMMAKPWKLVKPTELLDGVRWTPWVEGLYSYIYIYKYWYMWFARSALNNNWVSVES